jgi:PAS domain S-box-containing protein
VANADPKVQQALIGEALDHATTGILIADAGGRYIAANETVCRKLGYTREELLELTVADLAPFEEVPDDYLDVVRGKVVGGTYPLRCRDGTLIDTAFRVGEARVAGVQVFVAVSWFLDDLDERSTRA